MVSVFLVGFGVGVLFWWGVLLGLCSVYVCRSWVGVLMFCLVSGLVFFCFVFWCCGVCWFVLVCWCGYLFSNLGVFCGVVWFWVCVLCDCMVCVLCLCFVGSSGFLGFVFFGVFLVFSLLVGCMYVLFVDLVWLYGWVFVCFFFLLVWMSGLDSCGVVCGSFGVLCFWLVSVLFELVVLCFLCFCLSLECVLFVGWVFFGVFFVWLGGCVREYIVHRSAI